MKRTIKSHGVSFTIADVRVPTISDKNHRARILTTRVMGTSKFIVADLHPRAIRKFARDFAALAKKLEDK